MGYLLFNNPTQEILISSKYHKAIFGLYHVAFLNDNGEYVLSNKDRQSIIIALDFYKSRILEHSLYPVYDGSIFTRRSSKDKAVLRQVLGLPNILFDKLDLKKDIIKQLKFVNDVEKLKRIVYQNVYKNINKSKWYMDDFRLYCLKMGFFFPYDETKVFVNKINDTLPVYINEGLLDETLSKYYKEAISSRFVIDYQILDKDFISIMEKLDSFSFDERLSYFINGYENEKIDELNISTDDKLRYADILRKYLASLINILYDRYSFDILHQATSKLSYLSSSHIKQKRTVYTISSFSGEMYSKDNNEFVFPLFDKDRIYNLLKETYEEYKDDNLLLFYARLSLPYEGYKYIKDLDNIDIDKIISTLPFDNYPKSYEYISSKRYDEFYSYSQGEKEHQYIFLKRLIRQYGINYDLSLPFDQSEFNSLINIKKVSNIQNEDLANLFDNKKLSFSNDLFLDYSLDIKSNDYKLKRLLKEIDRVSNNQAANYFMNNLYNGTIQDKVYQLLALCHLEGRYSKSLLPFFNYVIHYPLKVVLSQFRLEAIRNGDELTLFALDSPRSEKDTYEPNMPLPYVSFSKLAYSFKGDYFSTPFLCECQKDAIINTIEKYGKIYDESNSKHSAVSKRQYIIDNLELPDEIKNSLKADKDIISQLHFKDHVCHLCNKSIPSYHEIDNQSPYGIYTTYIRAKAAKEGVYINYLLDEDTFDPFDGNKIYPLITYDEDKIKPCLKPYLNFTPKALLALIASVFGMNLSLDFFQNTLLNFLSFDEELIKKIVNGTLTDDELNSIDRVLLASLQLIYKSIERAYAVDVSKDIIPELESCPFSLNIDYNEKLPYPYIHLGPVFNAYSPTIDSDELYLCNCDKKAVLNIVTTFYQLFVDQLNPELLTPAILSLSGLPYRIQLKYKDYDFTAGSPDDFVSKLSFKDLICRRCTNITHRAFASPFFKVEPFEEDNAAESMFALNTLAKEGVYFEVSYGLFDLTFLDVSSDYKYDLSSLFDLSLPAIASPREGPSSNIYSFFVMSPSDLKAYIDEFTKAYSNKAELIAYVSSILLDTYSNNEKVFYEFFFKDFRRCNSYAELLRMLFPEISRVRYTMAEDCMNLILAFMTFLLKKLIEKYAHDERKIGR